ncbi:preprotein translocase subunit SecE [Thermodesulfobacteriota bacterium]
MKKKSQKSKQKSSSKKKTSTPKNIRVEKQGNKTASEKPPVKKPSRVQSKKGFDKKKEKPQSTFVYLKKAGQFLKDSRMELKKVKWPTRKELLASTAVVIVLTLFVAFYLGLIDFGLIKIIKRIVG